VYIFIILYQLLQIHIELYFKIFNLSSNFQ